MSRTHRLAAQGRIEEAAALLEDSGDLSGSEDDQRVLQALRRVPSVTERELKLDSFSHTFQEWQKLCAELRDRAQTPDVRRLLSVLMGEEEAIATSSTTWYGEMVAHLLYKKPTMKKVRCVCGGGGLPTAG